MGFRLNLQSSAFCFLHLIQSNLIALPDGTHPMTYQPSRAKVFHTREIPNSFPEFINDLHVLNSSLFLRENETSHLDVPPFSWGTENVFNEYIQRSIIHIPFFWNWGDPKIDLKSDSNEKKAKQIEHYSDSRWVPHEHFSRARYNFFTLFV